MVLHYLVKCNCLWCAIFHIADQVVQGNASLNLPLAVHDVVPGIHNIWHHIPWRKDKEFNTYLLRSWHKGINKERCKSLTHGRRHMALFNRIPFSTRRICDIYTSTYIRPVILDDCKWLQMLTLPKSPLRYSTRPVLTLSFMKSTWASTVSKNQSLFCCLSVDFMSLVSTISSAQWCMKKSYGAAGLSGSVSAMAVYN